ncbi:MAG TPA: UbiX family flavin prenyltransferase [Hadesarchaea archaeon]|nr:UbiX family flavin prenyltransferase [Hadesarchaea archaeon]
MHLIVAITGSSGVIYGVKLLEVCKKFGIETDLIISKPAETLLELELKRKVADIRRLVTRSYSPDDMTAPMSSGSYEVDGMVIVPCSMKTLGAIANGVTTDLISRAADVTLKQNRPLVLVPRETPLNLIHLENMVKLRRAGATILVAAPAFYHEPKGISDLVDFIAGRILEILDFDHKLYRRWKCCRE